MAGIESQEMRDLLVRLDQRVGDGFLNINAKLDEMNRRADGHENRIRALENDNQTRLSYVPRFEFVETQVHRHEGRFQQLEGASKGATFVANAGRVLIGAIVTAIGIFGFQFALVPKGKPVKLNEPATVELRR
jgi:hypothetical protein